MTFKGIMEQHCQRVHVQVTSKNLAGTSFMSRVAGNHIWKILYNLYTVHIPRIYPIYRRNHIYQKSHPPQSDPQRGHCVALEEQGAHNQLFSPIKKSTESSGQSKFEPNQVQHQLMVAYLKVLSSPVQTVVKRSKSYFQHMRDELSFSTLHSSASSSSSITASERDRATSSSAPACCIACWLTMCCVMSC